MDKVFGECKQCSQLVQRGSMRAVNVVSYRGNDVDTRIRLRLCQDCYKAMMERLKSIEWNGQLYNESEIQIDVDLADRCPEVPFSIKDIRNSAQGGAHG